MACRFPPKPPAGLNRNRLSETPKFAEGHVLPWQRRMATDDAYGVYFIFKSMEQGPSFRVSVPKYATKDPNYRILARQRSRFTHYYFYLRDQTLVASAIPFLLGLLE